MNIFKIDFEQLKEFARNFEFSGVEIFVNKSVVKDVLIKTSSVLIKTEKLCERTIIYAYSYKLNKHIFENSRKINLQICLTNDNAIIGYPVLLGSY